MPLSAAQFLEIVERDHQVPAAVIGVLRQQIAAAPQLITVAALAKYLVDSKHLPPAVANHILANAESWPVQSATQPQPEEELGLAPDDELDDHPRAKPLPTAPSASPLTVTTAVTQPLANRPPAAGVPVSQVQAFSEDELGLAPDEDEKDSPKAKPPSPVVKPISAPIGVASVTPVSVTPAAVVATPVVGIAPVKVLTSMTPVKPAASPSNARNVNNSPAKQPTAAKPAAAASPKQPAAGNRNRPVPATTHVPHETADSLVEYADDGDGLFADIGDTGLQALTGQAALDAPPPSLSARSRPDRRVSRKQNRWIVGGATAVVVLGLIGILVANSLRSNGEPEFALAEKTYEARDNQAAIGKFTEFLDGFSRHPRASVARVHLALSKLRLATADERDWPEALPNIPLILDPIARQSEFQPAQVEVVTLLTRIAEALTDSAVKAINNPQESRLRLDAAREALRLANEPRYVPGELHNDQLLQELAERLTLLEYNLDRSVTLEATLAAMTKALAAHDLAAAYAARQELVERYPDQSRAHSLLEKGRGLAAESLRQVKVTKQARAAVTQETPAAVTATLVLTTVPGKPAPADKVAPCFALIRGTAYALDAGTGRILWRRPIGAGGNAGQMPVAIGDGADILLVDARDHSLLRLDAITGKLRWRQVVGQPLLEPVAAGNRIFTATRDGLILSLDPAKGQADLQAQLPQPLALPLVAAPDGQAIYALAEHSHLYTLATADLACRKVTYLGHEPGTIEAPPLILPKHLLVAENRGDAHSLLRIFARGGEAPAELELQGIPLAGQVVSPLASDAGHVAMATESGPTYVFELTGRADAPVKKLAELSASHAGRTVRYLALQNGRLWVGDAGLQNYALAAIGGRAKPAWQGFAADPVVQPLQITRELVIVGRHDSDIPGVLISAVATGGGSSVWETRLGAPAITPWIAAGDASLVVARADGNLYQIDTAAARGMVRCQPLAVVREKKSAASLGRTVAVTQCLAMGPDQALLLRGPASASAVSLSDSAMRPYALPGTLLCPPLGAAGGVFAVCQPGEVYLLGSAGSRQKVEPFMPLVRPADSPAWHLAGAQTAGTQSAGERPLSVVVRGGQLFVMGLRTEPILHLAALGTAELPVPPDAAPAMAEKLVCVVDQAGNLQTYLLPELKPGPAWNPGSKIAWGPRAAGPVFVAATDDGHLHCFDAKEQRPQWKIKLSHAPLVSVCALGEQLFLASQDGMLSRLSLETGAEQGTQDLGEPLGEGLLSAGPALIVVSAEGSLLKVAAP